MSHIFRINAGGPTIYTDWNASNTFPYNAATRDKIQDPEGANAEKEITSIPTPFARMDLAKTAFEEVVRSNDHDGNSIYHKMVSDALDVGEIFFNIDKLSDKVEIIRWGKEDIETLTNGNVCEGHNVIADTLKKFLKADSGQFHFDRMSDIFLLNYTKGRYPLNIIGATSPITLFFSTANKIDYINDINFGTDKPFDNCYQPLYKRNFEYIKSLWVMRISIPNFAVDFRVINQYLDQTYSRLNQDQRNILNNLTVNNLGDYGQITIPGTAHIVNVIGYSISKDISLPPIGNSAFRIRPSIAQEEEILPLVLPVEPGSRYSGLQYVTDNWGSSNRAPYKAENQDLKLRRLPNEGSKLPYLTISDFLEDYIILSNRRPNKDYFFNGNFKTDKERLSVLLPLKPLFFKYFTTDVLINGFDNGTIKMIEINEVAGESLQVTLRIPIVGSAIVRYIEYNRTYYKDRVAEIAENCNDGGIKEVRFNSFIMPHILFSNIHDAQYRVGSLYANGGVEPELEFYSSDVRLQNVKKECRNINGIYNRTTNVYSIESQQFDYIRVSANLGTEYARGVFVPKFQKSQPISQFKFAIDLGTSNTHIEYSIVGHGNIQSKAFDVKNDKQLQGLYLYEETDDADVLLKDIMPDVIGDGDFNFPTRTVLTCAKTIDWNVVNNPMSMTNIGLIYGKRNQLPYNNDVTDIKWGGNTDYIKAYINNLMIMLRNKVVINNGDLATTEISWFFPTSMPPIIRGALTKAYDDSYQKYFNPNGNTNRISESIAPIRYYFNHYGNATRMVNVDIGGGTTDISYAENGNVLFTTSFRFATNVLFEDSYAPAARHNGIIDTFKEEIRQTLLSNQNFVELKEVFESIDNTGKPANLAAFLFGLKDISLVNGVNSSKIDFNSILQNDNRFKVVFLIFYAAIIYQIAQIIKTKGIAEPRHISFSGNGSKIITIITQDIQGKESILSGLTKAIFEAVLKRKYNGDLEILGLDKANNPKEATCKGAMLGGTGPNSCENLILSGFGDSFCTEEYCYSNAIKDKALAIENVNNFFKLLFEDVNSRFRFRDYLGIETLSLENAKKICINNNDSATYFDKGLAIQKGQEPDTEPLAETTFFYPIKGIINELSADIKNNIK